ncbi:MAG TPA: SMP-30/gluconolactonase/LRE family protein [Thermoanaerobaculia bacterium]|nr:SMP-30/gluconolactonase/LRE family protein [Thermoanaerobaculia bacterium]
MKRLTLILALALTFPLLGQTDAQLREAIQRLEQVVEQQPTNLPYVYILATYYDKAKDEEGVVRTLQKLLAAEWEYGLAKDGFRNSKSEAFRKVALSLHAREPKVNRAKTAFKIANRRDLIPEGIAYDPVDDVFYLSGLYHRNVVRVTRDGVATDFVKEAQDGMLAGLGMKVDAKRRLLWVVSGATKEMRGWKEGQQGGMLAAYDLKTGKLVKKHTTSEGMMNDLALLDDGSLYVTDTNRGHVLRLAPNGEKLEVWASEFLYPNGIAVLDGSLYVADFRGLTKLDLKDKTRTRVESKSLLNGIDGLAVHKGKLIGIQNAIGRPRVIRIDPATGVVENLESRNPRFEIPTTGAVAGDELYFIANPGLRSFDDAGKIWPIEKLEDPVMLRLAL